MATFTEVLAIIMVAVPEASSTSEASMHCQTERIRQLQQLVSAENQIWAPHLAKCYEWNVYLLLMLQPQYGVFGRPKTITKYKPSYSNLILGKKQHLPRL